MATDADETIDQLHQGRVSAEVLLKGLKDAVNEASDWAANCQLAEDTVACIWANQSDDGLKHAFTGDELPPAPWDGAHDTRIRLTERLVREHCSVAQLSVKRGKWKFSGGDFTEARRNTQLLKWQEARQIPAARRERNLFLRWGAVYGCVVMGQGWQRREEMGLRRVTVADLEQAFLAALGIAPETAPEAWPPQAMAHLEALALVLSDPEESLEWLEQWLRYLFPTASSKRVREGAKQLRDEGEADMPQKRIMQEGPERRALLPMRDVFFPVLTDDLPNAPWIATRDWFTLSEIENQRDVWDKAFIEELKKHPGKCSTMGMETYPVGEPGRKRWGMGRSHRRGVFTEQIDTVNRYEVFTFYHRSVDADGVTALYRTVCSPHVTGADGGYIVAEQSIYDDGTGTMPFDAYTIWDDQRALLDCRGIPYLTYTHQQEKKTLRDARLDVTDLSVTPMFVRHPADRTQPWRMGPDRQVLENVPGGTKFMPPPENRTGMARELEEVIDEEVNRLLGNWDERVPTALSGALQELIADQAIDAYERILTRTWQLNQKWLPEVTVTRVTGALREPFRVSREEIQGQFDVRIEFDPRTLDLDYALQKIRVLKEVTQMDVNRIGDINQVVARAYDMVDPDIAEAVIQDERVADEREIRETRDAINDILAGQEPLMREGINAALRQQYFEEQLQLNPMLVALQQSPDDPRLEMLLQYRQHLQHIYHNQHVAPAEGALGVKLQ